MPSASVLTFRSNPSPAAWWSSSSCSPVKCASLRRGKLQGAAKSVSKSSGSKSSDFKRHTHTLPVRIAEFHSAWLPPPLVLVGS